MADPLLDPPPMLGPLDLGLSPLRDAPGLPTLGAPPMDFKAKLLRLIAAGIAGGLGPGAGTGLLQGANLADQQKARDQQQKDQQARLLYHEDQTRYAQEARAHEQEADQRRAAFERTAQQLERVAPTLKSKADFDRTVEIYAQGLGNYGIRNAGLQLRQRVQYAEPKAADRANAFLEKFFKDPINKPLIEQPDQLQNRTFLVDLDGDGTSNRVSLAQLLRVAKRTELLDPATGKLGLLPSGKTPEDKANIDARYQNLLNIARADGKLVDGTSAEASRNRNTLMDKAISDADAAKPAGPKAPARDRFSIQPVTNADGTTSIVRVNLESGMADPVTLPQGTAGAGKPLETERTSKAYLDRAEPADQTARTFEGKLTTLGRQFNTQLPTLLATPEGQQYRQAQDEFINAALRRESGAAIQQSEYERYANIYFVRPGDAPSTIRQKQQARARVIGGFRQASGNLAKVPASAPSGEVWERGPDGRLRKKATP